MGDCSQRQQLIFDPSFIAGTLSHRAGAFSPETVTISRSGEDEEFHSIALQNPPGLLGMLSAVSLCTGAPALNGSCPAKSQIGTVAAGLGPAFSPFVLGGGVFLTGPYRGGPFGLVIEVPVGIGIFEIGEVVVRAALSIDPSSAVLSISSDPLPQSFDGLPLQLGSIHLDLDRRGFIFNPTSCRPSSIAATVTSAAGSVATESSPFRVVDCGSLPFRPRIGLRLSGATHRGGHPKLGAVLTMAPGGANIKRATVALPSTELIDSAHLPNPCTAAQFAIKGCPSRSVIGHARVETPMLNAPLAGPVYLRSSTKKLPEFVAVLGGQLEFDLNGRLATGKGGGVRASFESLPDVPISKFTLGLAGGGKGLLVNSMNLCSSASRAAVKLEGQNGKAVDSHSEIANSCHHTAKARPAH